MKKSVLLILSALLCGIQIYAAIESHKYGMYQEGQWCIAAAILFGIVFLAIAIIVPFKLNDYGPED